jgi:hypothetical protein
MRKNISFLLLLAIAVSSCQRAGYPSSNDSKALRVIKQSEVERIERTLSADDMEGRRTGTPGIEKAADFISAEFKKIGLQTLGNGTNFRQQFVMIRPKPISASAIFDMNTVDAQNIIAVTSAPNLKVNNQSGFEKVYIKAGAQLTTQANQYLQAKKNYLVIVDTSFSRSFSRLNSFRRQIFKSDNSVVFVMSHLDPTIYNITATHEMSEMSLSNVVGMIPGKSRKDEYVIFSGHYDHIGYGKAVNGDSLYNGANDDAAGTTAMMVLAKYFKALNNNERTLIFAAFTAEEIGGFGAQYFSRQLAPEKVVAMFNIEMIGTEGKWGKNAAFITGYDKTDMGKILEKNLVGSAFKFYPDPYPEQSLFYRSDNATLALLGVPAHTISTAKMDSEPHYHKPSDEIGTLNLINMTEIIKAIAISSKTIVSGKDTPSRVNTSDLRRN